MTLDVQKTGMSNLTLRILSALALVVIALVGVVLGGIPFWLLCVVLGLFMSAEWADLACDPARHQAAGAICAVRSAGDR